MVLRRALAPTFAVAPLFSFALALFPACSDDAASTPKADGGPSNPPVGLDASDGAAPVSELVFGNDATFQPRDCTVTLRYSGAANNVRLAGEFTNWEQGAITLQKRNGAFEVTLSPGAQTQGTTLEPGKRYAYKLIVDGEWRLDPEGTLRKVVGDQMNSAVRLPTCDAGPEVVSGTLKSDATGAASVRVSVRAARGGERPVKLEASLDGATVPAGSFTVVNREGAVDFSFTQLATGKHRLSVRAVDDKGRASEPVDLPFWIEAEPFSYRDGLLYMFMIDRFANGEKANDKPVGAPVHYDADWHGGDMQGALKVLQDGYFEKLGVRTIWLSPLNQQTDQAERGDGNQWYSAYHGYWPTRARDVEPRFGGKDALKAFVREAHRRGIRVLLDLINNQVYKDHEYITQHADWFRTACQCGNDAIGCGWSQRPFDCMFQPYLPDINWTRGEAEDRFVDDAIHWIAEYDFDGFRVDAVKHVESNSIYNMRAAVARRFEQGGARIFMVGETAVGQFDSGNFFGERFNDGFDWVDAYTGKTALDGQFDFPTRHNMADGLVNGQKPLSEVEAELRKAETRYRPDSLHVRFLNGHDNPRIASIAAQDPKLGCSWSSGCRGDALPPATYSDPVVFQRLKRALTVLYTLPGLPFLYAGDEIAFGGGSDPDMRRNMIFGEGALKSLEMSPQTLTAQQSDLREWVRKLGATRTASRALRRGERLTLLSEADLWVYAYQAGPGEVAVVAVNRGGAVNRTIPLGPLRTGSVTALVSATGNGTMNLSGAGLELQLAGQEAAIFVPRR
jgi:glycosidase